MKILYSNALDFVFIYLSNAKILSLLSLTSSGCLLFSVFIVVRERIQFCGYGLYTLGTNISAKLPLRSLNVKCASRAH